MQPIRRTSNAPVDAVLLLIRTFMDEVHYNERGNEVILIKRRRRSVPVGDGSEAA